MSKRMVDKAHLKAVSKLPCCCTGYHPVEVHHLIHGVGHGLGRKADDCWVIPLAARVHLAAHHHGRPEQYILDTYGIDCHKLARDLYANRGNREGMMSAIFRSRSTF